MWSSRARAREALGLGLLGLGLLSAPAAVAASPAADCTALALARVQARYADVADLAARFEQQSVSAAFPDAQLSSGTVEFAKPTRMRWRYEKPAPSLIVSDGSELWIVEPAAKQVQVLPVNEEFLSGTALQFLLGAATIEETFDARALSCEKGEALLRLLPRKAAHYEYLELVVELASGVLRETRVADLFGGRTRVRFEALRTNLAPPAARFRYTPAADERVLRLSPEDAAR